MRRSLSIRYKILLLLTIVPLVTLALYLILAVEVFKKDKLAYVFETGSVVSQTLSAQATTELNGVLNSAKPVIQEFLLDRSFGKMASAMMESDAQLEWVAAFEKNAQNNFIKLAVTERAQGAGEKDLTSFGNLTPLLGEVEKSNRLIRVPFKDDRVLIIEKIGEGSEQSVKYFLILSRLSELAKSFSQPSGAEIFLVNKQGLVLLGPEGLPGTYLSQRFPIDFLINASDKGSPTKELISNSGRNLLASFSYTNFGNLAVVSVVDRQEAFQAVDLLVRKSIIFFILLIAAGLIVSLFASGSVTSALTELSMATKKVAEGQFDIRLKVRSTDEIGNLANSFNVMADKVSFLMGETAEKARMQSELKTAQTVQETLFPMPDANMGGFEISGHYEPASECGGDWWHYSQVENKVFLWIGDATGHGAPAALITSAAKSAATIIERLNVDVEHALELLNRAIFDVSKGRIMMTFFLACFDLETEELSYANASHEGPYLIKSTREPLKKKNLIPLNEVTSPRLGQDRNTKYEKVTIKLDPGDRILFYTDGIPDIENPEKKAWGEREFIKAIIAANDHFISSQQAKQRLIQLYSQYRQGAPLKDDITFFFAHFSGQKRGET